MRASHPVNRKRSQPKRTDDLGSVGNIGSWIANCFFNIFKVPQGLLTKIAVELICNAVDKRPNRTFLAVYSEICGGKNRVGVTRNFESFYQQFDQVACFLCLGGHEHLIIQQLE